MSINLLFDLLTREVEITESYYSELILGSHLSFEFKAELLFTLYTDTHAFRRLCVTLIGIMHPQEDGVPSQE